MKSQPYLPLAPRTVKGIHRSGWGLAQLHGNQRWISPLDLPRHFLPAAPKGCDGSPGSSRLHARPMAGQKYHCPTPRIIALPGAARQFQNTLLAPSPSGDLGGTSGLALAPHLAVGMDWMKCVFGCQGSGNVFLVHLIAAGKGQKVTGFSNFVKNLKISSSTGRCASLRKRGTCAASGRFLYKTIPDISER